MEEYQGDAGPTLSGKSRKAKCRQKFRRLEVERVSGNSVARVQRVPAIDQGVLVELQELPRSIQRLPAELQEPLVAPEKSQRLAADLHEMNIQGLPARQGLPVSIQGPPAEWQGLPGGIQGLPVSIQGPPAEWQGLPAQGPGLPVNI